jgi:hypothetical protein
MSGGFSMKHYESTEPVELQQADIYDDVATVSRISRVLPYERNARHEAMMAALDGQRLVYAARVQDGLIKIGCTAHLYHRLINIKGELLGFMFGGYDDERALHRTLQADLHHGREWFHPTPAVMAVVNDLRADLGLEPIAA